MKPDFLLTPPNFCNLTPNLCLPPNMFDSELYFFGGWVGKISNLNTNFPPPPTGGGDFFPIFPPKKCLFGRNFNKNDPYLLKGGHFTANYDHLITFNGENLLGKKIPPKKNSQLGKSQNKYLPPPRKFFESPPGKKSPQWGGDLPLLGGAQVKSKKSSLRGGQHVKTAAPKAPPLGATCQNLNF